MRNARRIGPSVRPSASAGDASVWWRGAPLGPRTINRHGGLARQTPNEIPQSAPDRGPHQADRHRSPQLTVGPQLDTAYDHSIVAIVPPGGTSTAVRVGASAPDGVSIACRIGD